MPRRMKHPPTLLLEEHPHWHQLYHTAWQLACRNVETDLPSGWLPQLACIPGLGVTWSWDSCFMTLFARYGNGCVPVMNNLDNLYRLQRDDGYISMAYRQAENAPAFGERINPPLFAWVEDLYQRTTGDTSRLKRVLPHLVRFFDWIQQHRRRANGLYWFEDAGSSGMDNAPRSGYAAFALHGSDLCHIDLAAQQVLAAESIAALADVQQESALAERFRQEVVAIRDRIQQFHWNERTGFFYDLFNRSEPDERLNHVNHRTAAAFWTLAAGVCTEPQAERLIEQITSPDAFWTEHPVATLARDDPNYDPDGGYWLGGIWAPINYMIVQGLERYGRYDLARRLASEHLNRMSQVMLDPAYAGIWECYAPEGSRPGTNGRGRQCRPNFVGWSGLGPIALLLETVLGLRITAGGRSVVWRIHTHGRHGVESLHLGANCLSFISSGLQTDAPNKPLDLQVTSAHPMDLTLILPSWQHRQTHALPAGTHSLKLLPPG